MTYLFIIPQGIHSLSISLFIALNKNLFQHKKKIKKVKNWNQFILKKKNIMVLCNLERVSLPEKKKEKTWNK